MNTDKNKTVEMLETVKDLLRPIDMLKNTNVVHALVEIDAIIAQLKSQPEEHRGEEARDVEDIIAELQANGWEYGTHPREKARIVMKAIAPYLKTNPITIDAAGLEKAARAMCETKYLISGKELSAIWDSYSEGGKENFRRDVRAALRAAGIAIKE